MAGYCSNWTPLELAVSVRLLGAMITTKEGRYQLLESVLDSCVPSYRESKEMTKERQGAIMVSKELSVWQKLSPPLFFYCREGGGGAGEGAASKEGNFLSLRLNHLANQNVKFTSSLPLAKPAIKYIYFLNRF